MADCRGHGGCCDHSHIDEDRGAEYSLFRKIDVENLEVLNEADEGSGKCVFRSWDERLDTNKYVESDMDEELLFNIPFTGCVKLKGIILIGGENGQHPNVMKLFKNRPRMTFDETTSKAEQVFELVHDANGTVEYATKVPRFSSVQCLSIYLPSNFGDETTKVYYIGLKGEFQEAHRHEVTICNYEARANPADHKTKLFDNVNQSVS